MSKFNFLFQLSSYATRKVFLNLSLAINMASQDSYYKFDFFFHFKNAQNTQNVNEKTRILVDKPWKFKSNTVLSLICRGVLAIQSNICNKSVGTIVNGV